MKRSLIFILLMFSVCWLRAADYYWVNGTGNWSDLNHWRIGSSAGPIAGIVPSSADNVFFGSYSGLGSGSTVTVNANAFCNNMTWESGIPSVTNFTGNGVFTVTISGNLVLAPTVTYNFIYVNFTGASNATLTSNGTVLGTLNMTIDKPGSGLTLADNLIYNSVGNTRNTITLNAGYFNAPGKTIKANGIISDVANTRSVDISNATLELGTWSCIGANKTVNVTLSHIKTYNIFVDEGNYHIAEVDAVNYERIVIDNTTFQRITFTDPLGHSEARIGNNNIIDSIIFNGGGTVRANNNTVHYMTAGGSGTVGGTGNQIHYADVKGTFSIIETGNNVFDTLLTAPNKNIQISGTNTITKYFRAGGLPCDGFTEITGVASGTLNFSGGADFDIDNVLLTNLSTTGAGTITVNGIDNGGNTGFTINPPAAPGTTLYWVGGPGDWNDKNHWSYTSGSSGGTGGACIPFINDNVVFDAGSGLSAGNHTVTTSANTYCRDMTWAAGVGTAIFSETTSFSMRVYGSVVLQPTVTMNAEAVFVGTDPAAITFNGGGAGTFRLIVSKTGAGSLTFSDNWLNTAGSIAHGSGNLNMAGRTVSINFYNGKSVQTRGLDISNATVTTASYWDYRGGGKTLNATGSHLSSNGGFGTDGLSYPWVDITGTSGTGIGWPISGTTFGQLTYTDPSPSSGVFLPGSNTVRRLEFKSNGLVGANCIVDSLILTGSRVYTIGNNVQLNKYLMAESVGCNALMEIRGPGSIAFAPTAELHIANVYMANMTATGQNPSFNGADAGGNVGWTINSATAGARYWVGGAGDWSDPLHWSATSGGTPGSACVPTVNDDVYFDAGSGFSAVSKTVTINNGHAYCRNMNWTGVTSSPILSKNVSFNLEIWGNLVMNSTVTTTGRVNFVGPANTTITSNGASLGNFDIIILKPAGSTLTLADNYSNSTTEIELRSGGLNMSGRTVTVQWLTDVDVATASSVNITNTIFNGGWHYRGVAKTVQAAGSVLNASLFRSNGHTYNVVNASSVIDNNYSIVNTTIDSLVFTDPSTTSQAWLGGTNTINYLEFKGKGFINGTNNTINTLVFFPGNIYTFLAGSNNTITGEWYGSGTPCKPTEILSSSVSSNATVTKTSGSVDLDYVRLQRITAAGGAVPFIAREHSNDLGNNVNWNISAYNGAAPILGLGPDVAVSEHDFPYTLTTDGFFPSPSSTYLWNDNSTASTLQISGPGNYSVNVTLAGGCNVNDAIVVTEVLVEDADLVTTKVLKDATKTNYVPGEDVVYTITVTNNGPDNASNVNIVDNAPSGTTINSWTATVQTGTVTLPHPSGTGNLNETIATMPSGAAVVYEVTVRTTASTTGSLSNTVAVTTTSVDPDLSCPACTTTPLPKAAVADIVIAKALKDATKTNYVPGEDVVYTITVTNNGPDNASGVNITDNAPAGTTISSWTASVQTGTVTLPNASGTGNLNQTIVTMPNGAVVVYEVTVRTTASSTGSLSNSVAVTTTSVDPDPSCTACTTAGLPKAAVADIVTTKTLKDATKTNYVPGEDVVYTITVTNNGPDNASGVNITDNAPAGTTISSWTASVQTGTVTLPNASGTGNLNQTIATMPNGAVVVYEVTVRTTASSTGSLSNSVAVTTTSVDPDPSCTACTTAGLPKAAVADIVTTKTLKDATKTNYVPGEDVVYTITVTNNGPDNASGVNITDNAPAGTTISSWTASVQTGTVTLPNASGTGNLNQTIATMPNGAVVVYEVTVRTTASTTGSLSNTAAVTTTSVDPDPSCPACTTTPLPKAAVADIVIAKALKDATKTNYVPGEDVVYTITVTNNGPDNASGVNITDNSPAGTTISSWTASVQTGTVTLPNASGTGNLNQTIATMPNGAVVVYEVTVRTTASTTGSLSNTAAVTTTSVDPDPSCTACTTAPLPKAAVADIVTTKTLKDATKTNYIPGEDVVYTITVTNNGPDNASGVNITDNSPAGTTISSWTASVQTGTVTLPNASGTGNLNQTIATMPNGAVVVYEVTVRTTASTTGSLSNSVAVTTTSVDPDPSCATCTTAPLPKGVIADIVTVKTLKNNSQTDFVPGQAVLYTITVTNNGPDNASNVSINDNAPAGTTIDTWTATVQSGTVSLQNTSGTGNLNEIIATMPNGAVVVYEVSVLTSETFTGSLINTVQVSATSHDPDNSCPGCIAPAVTSLASAVANNDNAITKDGVAAVIRVLDNDNPAPSGGLLPVIEIITQPAHGTVTVNADGTITFRGTPGYTGNDVFAYRFKDNNGIWSNVAQVNITVTENEVHVQNIITPNGDGKNDKLIIRGLEKYQNNTLILFNRWNNKIYESKNYKGDWNGIGLGSGTYFYTLRLQDHNGQWHTVNGYITLIR